MNQPWIYMCSPSWSPLPSPSPSHPSVSSQCTSPEHLSHASNLGWRSVSHLIIYMFQCYSLRSSHPCLLPQSPNVSPIHLHLFFCPAFRVIITIFLNSFLSHSNVYCLGWGDIMLGVRTELSTADEKEMMLRRARRRVGLGSLSWCRKPHESQLWPPPWHTSLSSESPSSWWSLKVAKC